MSLRLALVVLASSSLFACANRPPHAPPLPDDSFPPVLGLPAAEDLDPHGDAVEYELVVAETDVALLDGTTTSMFTYNGTSPGPVLQANVGDHVKVTVTNHLDEATTIHWHGIRVPNEMDGIVHGELKAIEPGESFTYEFTARDAGTFWYHPHIRTNVQVEAGLQGMFVIHEKDAPDVDGDRALVLDDIYLRDNGEIMPPGGGMEISMGRVGNHLLVNGVLDQGTAALGAGRVERWRIVNTSNAYTQQLRFKGLSVREIGADGGLWPQASCKDVSNDDVILPAGARTELEVRLAEGATEASLISVLLYLDNNDNVQEEEYPLVSVLIDKNLAVDDADVRAGWTGNPSLPDVDTSAAIDKTLKLSGYNSNGTVHFTINGHSWPDYENWSVNAGELQTIVVQNDIMMEHPFHLHGNFFQIVKRGTTVVDEPGLRDTVLVPGNSKVTIQTRFENPGMWMYHCHILEHEENGMMGMVDVVGDDAMDMN